MTALPLGREPLGKSAQRNEHNYVQAAMKLCNGRVSFKLRATEADEELSPGLKGRTGLKLCPRHLPVVPGEQLLGCTAGRGKGSLAASTWCTHT